MLRAASLSVPMLRTASHLAAALRCVVALASALAGAATLQRAEAISAGGLQSVALLKGGSTVAWGGETSVSPRPCRRASRACWQCPRAVATTSWTDPSSEPTSMQRVPKGGS